MAASSEEIKKHVKVYWTVLFALAILTIVTVYASGLELVFSMAVFIAMIIAIVKGSLVASFFMHLFFDKNRAIGALLVLCGFFFLALMILPVLIMSETVDTVNVP